MAKIPAITRLAIEQFPDQKDWIGKLLNPMNSFLGATVFALTKHLTFSDNFLGQENFLDFTYNGSQSLPVNFLLTMNAVPLSLLVVSALENSVPIGISAAWQINQNNQVSITDFTKLSNGKASALTAGARYQVRVRIAP